MEDHVHRFVMGLEPHLLKDCISVSLQPGMDISRIKAYVQGVEECKQKQRADHEHDSGQSKRERSLGPSGEFRGGQSQQYPRPRYGRLSDERWFKRNSTSGICSWFVIISTPPPEQGSQAPMGRGRGRGRASISSGPQNRIYTLAGRQDQESSPDVVTGILPVSSYDVYALIDPGSTLSYVTPLVARKFGIEPELIKPFEVSTPVGDPVIARWVN
ncbi:uncharacterized protein [Nicotiana tomentosiformis]|uniref:uncharacterized protein n=1 Tax=Nicotiana tomentosiformis TaxID=4098 RepID=UPI00388CA9A5